MGKEIKEKFKAGDMVYCPYLGTKVLVVKMDKDLTRQYPMELDTGDDSETFTDDGHITLESPLPMVFKATKENQDKLESLFGVKFEEAPETDCQAVCISNLPVVCKVSKKSVADAKEKLRVRIIVSTSVEKDFKYGVPTYNYKFTDSEGVVWPFAVILESYFMGNN